MTDVTIVYYTANTEDEAFEQKVRDNILENSGGLPIVSVSRKPIDFGQNICVGEQPRCYANSIRQLRVGLWAAETEFVLAAESDVLYPPEYFQFVPPRSDRVYRYDNVWVMYTWTSRRYYGKFWQKSYTEGAQMCGRKYWLECVDKVVDKDWNNTVNPPLVFKRGKRGLTWTGNPVITCKTPHNLGRYTTTVYVGTDELPYWGSVEKVERWLS